MYIQITTRCNMTCEHCCFSCTSKGEDMSFETFKNIVDNHCDEYLTIGGGEPTIHPDFAKMLLYAIASSRVFIVTNGKIKHHALLLAKLTKNNVIDAELSVDDFHDEISSEVEEAFFDLGKNSYTREPAKIRNVTEKVIKTGRAIEQNVWVEKGCACPDIIAKPDGTFKQCGCDNAPTIDIDNLPDDFYDMECFND